MIATASNLLRSSKFVTNYYQAKLGGATMNKLEIINEQIIVYISGWDKFFALKSTFTFPQANITNVYAYDDSISPPWLKSPGTVIPGKIIAGTYQNLKDRKEFWCTHFKGNTIVIDLQHEEYDRIVLDLSPEQPINEWISHLNQLAPAVSR
jgi:hypothetical protein